jgi:hypothetical protein
MPLLPCETRCFCGMEQTEYCDSVVYPVLYSQEHMFHSRVLRAEYPRLSFFDGFLQYFRKTFLE